MSTGEDFPAIRLVDLIDALEFVSASRFEENQAWLCTATGRIIFVSDSIDPVDEIPEDPESAGYLAIPGRRDLALGKPLAISFVDAKLPEHAAKVRDIFRRRGAYARFKEILRTAGALEAWYEYEEQATHDALRRWCEEAGLTIIEDGTRA